MIDSAYEATRWTYLFAASMAALATLTGLVFVAGSTNVRAILENPGLPERAAATLVVLLGPLVISALVLIPGQSVTALGIEIGCVTLTFAAMLAGLVEKMRGHGVSGKWVGQRATLASLMVGPLLRSAASPLLKTGGGLYWIVARVLASVLGAVANAWVLLIEILRRSMRVCLMRQPHQSRWERVIRYERPPLQVPGAAWA